MIPHSHFIYSPFLLLDILRFGELPFLLDGKADASRQDALFLLQPLFDSFEEGWIAVDRPVGNRREIGEPYVNSDSRSRLCERLDVRLDQQGDEILSARYLPDRCVQDAALDFPAIRETDPPKLRQFKPVAYDADVRQLILLLDVRFVRLNRIFLALESGCLVLLRKEPIK